MLIIMLFVLEQGQGGSEREISCSSSPANRLKPSQALAKYAPTLVFNSFAARASHAIRCKGGGCRRRHNRFVRCYHLGHLGWNDVVVLERDKVTSGTTWHAAGLMVTFGSTSETSTELRKYTKQLYSSLEEETGQVTGFNPVGFIEVASNTDRLEEYRRVAAFNRKCGVDVKEISPAEIESLFPLCDTSDLLAGFYVEDDGRVNPVDATQHS